MPNLKTALTGDFIHKKPIVRSVAYPAYNINYALDLTKLIYTHFGKSGYNTRETIAKVLKKSADYLKTPLSSATQYGLLDMKQKAGYKPTDLFMQLYKQDNDQLRNDALLQCIKNPKLYALLISAYEGHILPSPVALSNTLFKDYGIAENTSEKATEVFIDNLKTLDLLDSENKLTISSDNDDYIDNIEELEEEDALPTMVTQSNPVHKHLYNQTINLNNDSSDELPMHILLSGGRRAKLIYPIDITNEDWEKIVRVIGAMKE